MKTRSEVKAPTVDRWSVGQVREKRTLSRMLVNMLVEESSFKQAAEIVSGAELVFGMYEGKLNGVNNAGLNSSARLEELESLLITGRSEVAYQRQWSEDVLAKLPKHPGTEVLRGAFARADACGTRLLQTVELASSKYQEARANASTHNH